MNDDLFSRKSSTISSTCLRSSLIFASYSPMASRSERHPSRRVRSFHGTYPVSYAVYAHEPMLEESRR